MFGRLFGKSKQPSRKPEKEAATILTMPLLKSKAPIEPSAVVTAANRLCPENPFKLEVDGKDAAGGFTFGSRDAMVIGMHIPERIPSPEVDGAATMSIGWPKDEPKVEYASHVVLVSRSEAGEKVAALAATRVAAAIMETQQAAGWYVGDASMVHKPEVVVDFAKDAIEDERFPVFLWVNVIVSQDAPGRYSGSTLGMASLGLMEFEVVKSARKPSDLMEGILDMASYVLDSGAALEHGQTIGHSATEKWSIEVGKSKLGKEGSVIRIGIP